MKISVIIPVFNEEESIEDCLSSLEKQSYKDFEIIVVDDGSTDKTLEIVKNFPVKLFTQEHLGAGAARNFGATEAGGEVLVFVDADMTFDKKFIELLTKPIRNGKVIGTFSKYEYVTNKNNIWSRCWNINHNLPQSKMHSDKYPDTQPVFRSILKKEFKKAGGFDLIGYIDDHTLAKKLKVMAVSAPGAIFYHKNPATLKEVFSQSRWIGKSEFKNRKIKNELIMKVVTKIRYSLPFSFFIGIYKSIRYKIPQFLIFKFVYDCGIEISILGSFFGEQKYK